MLRAQRTEMATIAAAFLFEAPLVRLAGWSNERYGLFINGRSGSLKTSWAQVRMCLYGPEFLNDDKLLKWGDGATANAIMATATYAHDLPLLIDNYKPTTGGDARTLINVIHNIVEGGDKSRLNRASELRDVNIIHCLPLITGEDVPDTNPASLARLLVVPFTWPKDVDNLHLHKAQHLSPHLCAVGAAWLNWLESGDGVEAARHAQERFPQMRSQWATLLRQQQVDMVNPLRVATNLATNTLTWWVMEQCPFLHDIAREYRAAHANGLREIAGTMAMRTGESLEAARYLATLCPILATERSILIGHQQEIPTDNQGRGVSNVIGYHGDDGTAYILPIMARQEVERMLSGSGDLVASANARSIHSYRQWAPWPVTIEIG